MNLITAIKAMYDISPLKKSVASLDERLGSLNAEIRATQAQRDKIANAPAARSDVRDLAERWVDAQAVGWSADVATTLRPTMVRATTLAGGPVRAGVLSIVNPADPQASGACSAADVNAMVCAVFRDQVVDALHAAIDGAIDWPDEGLPVDQRPQATAGLEAKLAELNAEQERLRAQAAELGLNRY